MKNCFIKCFALLLTFSSSVWAQNFDAEEIRLIRETARDICETVEEQSGSRTKFQLEGDVRLRIAGLAKALVDTNGKGRLDVTRESFEGLSQQAMELALEGDRGCRERVFNRMFESLSAPADPKKVYIESGRQDDLRAIQDYVIYTPITVRRGEGQRACDPGDSDSQTREVRFESDTLTISNNTMSSDERCSTGFNVRRETTTVCTARVRDLDSVVQLWTSTLKLACLSGDCFTCRESSRWKNFQTPWTTERRTYRIFYNEIHGGAPTLSPREQTRQVGVARAIARVISSGSDRAFCARYSNVCS